MTYYSSFITWKFPQLQLYQSTLDSFVTIIAAVDILIVEF